MKMKAMMLTAISALVVLFCLSLSAWGNASGKGGDENGPVPSPSPYNTGGTKYKTVSLGCSTGVIYTLVTNNTGKNIPAGATITVHGVQGDCTQTANGPLAKGKSIKLLGCQEKVTTCTATAKWALDD